MINKICFSQSIGCRAWEGQCAEVTICISKQVSRGPIGNPYHFVGLYFIFSCVRVRVITDCYWSSSLYLLPGTALGLKCQNVFREFDVPPSGFLIFLISASPIPLTQPKSLHSLPPSLPPSLSLLQQSWKLNPAIFPPTVPVCCSLGNESAHYSNKYLWGVEGIHPESLQRRPPVPASTFSVCLFSPSSYFVYLNWL